MNGWRSRGGVGAGGCQPPLSTLLPVGDRKLAAVFPLSQTSLAVSRVGSSHIFILSLSVHFFFSSMCLFCLGALPPSYLC